VAIKGYEGGQMPIYMRLPKRGFNVPNPKRYAVINRLVQKFIELKKLKIDNSITEDALILSGLVTRKFNGVRILAKGKITSKIDLVVTGASRAAVKAVEEAGGTVSFTQ
jgi:large subunit ribosomal protein L15